MKKPPSDAALLLIGIPFDATHHVFHLFDKDHGLAEREKAGVDGGYRVLGGELQNYRCRSCT